MPARLWRKFEERRLHLSCGRIPSYNVPPQRPSTPETPAILISGPATIVPLIYPPRAYQTAFCPPPRGKEEFLAWMNKGSKKQLKAVLRARNQGQQEIIEEMDTEDFKDKTNEVWMNGGTVNFPEDKILQPAPEAPNRRGHHLGGDGSARLYRGVLAKPGQSSRSDYEVSGGLFSSSPDTDILGNEALLKANTPWRGHADSRRDPKTSNTEKRRGKASKNKKQVRLSPAGRSPL